MMRLNQTETRHPGVRYLKYQPQISFNSNAVRGHLNTTPAWIYCCWAPEFSLVTMFGRFCIENGRVDTDSPSWCSVICMVQGLFFYRKFLESYINYGRNPNIIVSFRLLKDKRNGWESKWTREAVWQTSFEWIINILQILQTLNNNQQRQELKFQNPLPKLSKLYNDDKPHS